MKKIGKIGRINIKANKLIAKMWIDRDITYCEYPYSHLCSEGTTNAHKHKRRWYRSNPELLWDFKQVIKLCAHGHALIESDEELTKKVFKELRGEDGLCECCGEPALPENIVCKDCL